MFELYTMNDFSITLDMEQILISLECTPQSHSYHKVVTLIQYMGPKLLSNITPYAWYRFMKTDMGDRIVVCLLTLGNKIDEYMGELMKEKTSFPALTGNAILQDYMFQIDDSMLRSIEAVCRERKAGIIRRLNPPMDYPWEGQKWILDIIDNHASAGVSLTDSYIFTPSYTMGYILLLGGEKDGFHGRHDCSKCTSQVCSRRRADRRNLL